MCLTTNDPTLKTAQENMVVYKLIEGNRRSIHNNYKYVVGKSNPTILLIGYLPYSNSEVYKFDDGYHSSPYPDITGDGPSNSVFVIPKGASYVEGYNNNSSQKNYVSSTIIYVGMTETNWQRFWTNRRLKKYK